MSKFLIGLILGLILGISVTSYAASIVGSSPLSGWTVTEGDRTVCTDPEVDFKTKEIQCEDIDPRDYMNEPR
jgi:hypothetical protein